ncbi:unnamed protein product [Parajaminaea phylloscopi]
MASPRRSRRLATKIDPVALVEVSVPVRKTDSSTHAQQTGRVTAKSVSAEQAKVPEARKRKRDKNTCNEPAKRRKGGTTRKSADEAAQAMVNAEAMHAFDDNDHWVGAHMSIAKGVENAIPSARLYGCQAFALFLKPKMNWTYKALANENIQRFTEMLPRYGYDGRRCLPHGSYLINLGHPDPEKHARGLESFLDDLRRCALLGIRLYNFHPGSGVGDCEKSEACANIAKSINAAHDILTSEGLACPIILLENMAGQGQQIGGRFEELADVIRQVRNKDLVGVCLDTAHAFAAGFDIRTCAGFEKMISHLDSTVGLRHLKGMHLNDSKESLGSHKDRHENLGGGHIGLAPFWCIMNDSRFRHMPLTLETPAASWKVWQGEIQALYMLQGLPESPASWRPVEEKLALLRSLPVELNKGNSLADAAKAAKRALGDVAYPVTK